MHNTPPPNVPSDPTARRSSVVPLASAVGGGQSPSAPPTPGTTDHVPTILGENPFARPVVASFALPPGSTLGHFEIVGPLGAGGMATVFKAKDLTLGREVALKILPPTLAADPDAVSRFKFEARAAAKLNHDHVARVFFIGEDQGLHFIAFEFVDGRTLRDLIDLDGPIPPADAVRYMLDVAVGLQHAAEKGVVHRDVKPSNIIVTPTGRAKLIDMGLARSVDPHSVNGQVTQSGMTLGTFDYISPEQAIDPRRADIRSDIYSLGCTFYHALAGQTPVPDGNAARKLAAHQAESPVDPRLINPNIPDELAAVLDRMMTKLPAHRYQTAAELIADLNRVAVPMGLASGVSESNAHTASAPSASPSGKNTLAFLSLTVAVVAMSVAVVILVVTNGGHQSASLPPPPWADSPRPTVPAELVTPDTTPALPPKTSAQVLVVNVTELMKALKDNVPKIKLAGGQYDLTGEAGAVLSNKVVELDSPDGALLKLTAAPRGDKATDPRPGTLTFHKCEVVRLKGVRVDFSHTGDTPRGIGLLFQDVSSVDVSDCRFTVSSAGAMDGVMLAFTRVGSLTARHGFFQSKSWAAVELSGGVKAAFDECGFIVGRAAIEVVPAAELMTTPVVLTHATFLLNNTAAAVNVLKGGRCDMTASNSLFAAPVTTDMGMMTDRKAVLRSAETSDGSTFTIPDKVTCAVFGVEPPAVGHTPVLLPASPWASSPRTDSENVFAALELNTKLPLLRVGKEKDDILGVREWNSQRKVYTTWPLSTLARPNEAIWFPKMTPEEKAVNAENVFADLKEAVAYLKGKGTLRVRGRGVILMPSLVLDAGTRSITVMPDEDSAPILTPAKGGDRRETTLFRLEAGELRLEGLQFNVKPGEVADAAAVVSMTGGKKCEMRKCVLTLDEGNAERHAVVASFSDVGKVMVAKEFTDQPTVTLQDCFVRGRGGVARAEASVTATVNLNNVGVATEGAPAFDFGPPARAATVTVNLTHVTAALAAPLFDVRATRRPDDKPTVKVDLRVDNSLFVVLDNITEPFIRATGVDPTATDRQLVWTTTGGNAFGGWATFAEVLADDSTEPKKWDAAEWRKWSGEPESVSVQLKKPPASRSTARLTDLEPSDGTTAGVNLKSLVGLLPE